MSLKRCSKEGFVLMAVIIILAVLLIYVVALISISHSSLRGTAHNRDNAMATSSSEAGLSMVITKLNEDLYWPAYETNPAAEWGKGFLSWNDISDGKTQFKAKVYNNYKGTGDRDTEEGERVPRGSIQVVTEGRLTRNNITTKIKTFLKPNAKIPAVISSGKIDLRGSIFGRGIENLYSLTTTPGCDICSNNNITCDSTPPAEFILDGILSSNGSITIGFFSPSRHRGILSYMDRNIPPPEEDAVNLPDDSEMRSLILELQNMTPPYNPPYQADQDVFIVDADYLNQLYPYNFYMYQDNLKIVNGPLILNDKNIYVVNAHVLDIEGGVTGNGIITAIGNDATHPDYGPCSPSITMEGIDEFSINNYPPAGRLVLHAEGNIYIKGSENVLSKSGSSLPSPAPEFDSWYEALYDIISARFLTGSMESYNPVLLEDFIQNTSVQSDLVAKGIGTTVITNLEDYLIEGRPHYNPALASIDCKLIVTHSNPDIPHSQTALQDFLYTISREYPFVFGMIYSESDIKVTGHVHIIGTLIANNPSDALKGTIETEDGKTILFTPTVESCMSFSSDLLKNPKFKEVSSVIVGGEGTVFSPPDPTPAPPPPSGGGGGGGGGGGCFLPGAMVKTSDGQKKIEEINPGDTVMAFDGENFSEFKVEKVLVHENNTDNYYILRTEKSAVKVTGNHPFYTGEYKITDQSIKNLKRLFNSEKVNLLEKFKGTVFSGKKELRERLEKLEFTGEEIKVIIDYALYKQLRDLQEGDYIYSFVEGKLVRDKIISKELIKTDHLITVYDIELEKDSPHNYISNGYIVHNNMAEMKMLQ